jgi:hypothetical protein
MLPSGSIRSHRFADSGRAHLRHFDVEPFLAGDTFAAGMSSTVTSIIHDIVTPPAL